MKKALFLLTTLFTLFATYAQQTTVKCDQEYVKQTLTDHFGSYEELRNDVEAELAKYPDAGPGAEAIVFTVPVVVHVIYDKPENNISRAQVLDAIRILNRDYRRRNADTANTRALFKPVAADVEIEFQLAKLDPNGNCTDGITRTFSSLTNNASNNVKPLVHWDNNKYLNIWVVASINSASTPGTILGYAGFPVVGNQPYTTDGIVIRNDQMGSIGTASAGGRTLVHEAGHYLNLYHPFQGGCFGGDQCNDTPPVAQSNSGCNFNANSCSNDVPNLVDQVENYMDYSDDECTNMFTSCQRGRMRATLTSNQLRGSLVSSNNALATGISTGMSLPCAPMPDFKANERVICEGESVAFQDMTYMGNPTSMQWTFSGGNPATSTSQNPIVTYNQKGNYQVELVTTNASGTAVKTSRGYISVRSQTNTPYVNTFSDDFEAFPIPNNNWHVVTGVDTMNFRYFSKTAFAGQSCVTLQNFGAFEGETDELISHAISLENATSAQLVFDFAFAERAFGNSDKLRIYISTDCGETWNLESNRQGPLLRSTNVRPDTAWWPTTTSEWRQGVVNLSPYAASPDYIMIKFEFENGGGNNFYIDEPKVTATIGSPEEIALTHVKIYPNPANDQVNVELNTNQIANITLMDISGRRVLNQSTNGNRLVSIETGSLSSGLYVLQIEINGRTSNHKIVIE